MSDAPDFGLARSTAGELRRAFDASPDIERVWIFGSRANGRARDNSDVDLAVDAPTLSPQGFQRLHTRLLELPTLHKLDVVHWQGVTEPVFRAEIERDRQEFWAPKRHSADVEAIGSVELKGFQTDVLGQLARLLDELTRYEAQWRQLAAQLRSMEGAEELLEQARDFPKKAWTALAKHGALPPAFSKQAYSSRFDGAGRAVPNVCLKVPTGGGKTLLAAASVARVFSQYLHRHAGLVLWVVPNEAIYRQTLKALADRDHPYRQILNVAAAGRVKVLEKSSPLTRLDVESNLCVMLLMLQSASRQSKETLKFFRDRGNVLGFLPREDDVEAHFELLSQVPNLDVYAAVGASQEQARAQKGSIVKSSLGNVMRVVRPMVVIDEGHHAYSETALRTLDGFNPCFMLELSATPRIASAKASGSNILVDVRGKDLDDAEMIKLPIHVDVKRWNDWQSCLAAALEQLDQLEREAQALRSETARYIRPILLVQVERTGADLRDAGFIHAEDAKAHLLQLGLSERQIAIKTSEKNDLQAPENIDLLSPTCEVRAIVTKAALQEGWDCPFAYVLCALAAGRNPAAMTQLVGRILRLPHVAKTGRAALDACYVLCHDARTGDVVKSIKKSLEGEGMGDLTVVVRDGGDDPSLPKPVTFKRRPAFERLHLFVPRVTWAERGRRRRELVYESDVLALLPWDRIDPAALATTWAPDRQAGAGDHFTIDLGILTGMRAPHGLTGDATQRELDRARLVRGLLDLAPNPWLVWTWVDSVCRRLLQAGHTETQLAGSAASLLERLRIDIEAQRDTLAQEVFNRLLSEGRIEFRLRADATDIELPTEAVEQLSGRQRPWARDDGRPVEKSLLEPALRTADLNAFEEAFAGYLDQKAALQWWHRNVAKAQIGLQGWRRYKVYPDFIFAVSAAGGAARTVLIETKGVHLSGSDTIYKQQLLEHLTQAYRDERLARAGELSLSGGAQVDVVCDLVFQADWRGTLEHRYFEAPNLKTEAAR
jgi:type III restriction enzyme